MPRSRATRALCVPNCVISTCKYRCTARPRHAHTELHIYKRTDREAYTQRVVYTKIDRKKCAWSAVSKRAKERVFVCVCVGGRLCRAERWGACANACDYMCEHSGWCGVVRQEEVGAAFCQAHLGVSSMGRQVVQARHQRLLIHHSPRYSRSLPCQSLHRELAHTHTTRTHTGAQARINADRRTDLHRARRPRGPPAAVPPAQGPTHLSPIRTCIQRERQSAYLSLLPLYPSAARTRADARAPLSRKVCSSSIAAIFYLWHRGHFLP
jgi:hypothetical protein